MSDLKVEVVARDELGAIVALITPHGVVDAQFASAQIHRGEASYVTGPDSFVRVPVRAIATLGGSYLYANWDGTRRNNMNDLAAVRVRRFSTEPATLTDDAEQNARPRRIATLWSRLFGVRY